VASAIILTDDAEMQYGASSEESPFIMSETLAIYLFGLSTGAALSLSFAPRRSVVRRPARLRVLLIGLLMIAGAAVSHWFPVLGNVLLEIRPSIPCDHQSAIPTSITGECQ